MNSPCTDRGVVVLARMGPKDMEEISEEERWEVEKEAEDLLKGGPSGGPVVGATKGSLGQESPCEFGWYG